MGDGDGEEDGVSGARFSPRSLIFFWPVRFNSIHDFGWWCYIEGRQIRSIQGRGSRRIFRILKPGFVELHRVRPTDRPTLPPTRQARSATMYANCSMHKIHLVAVALLGMTALRCSQAALCDAFATEAECGTLRLFFCVDPAGAASEDRRCSDGGCDCVRW